MVKLSIIVPAYNSEKFLRRSVISMINQNVVRAEYEIIVVDDGSTDNTLSLLLQLKKEATNIKVITQENQGLSGARNTGINSACGKYVWFVDADDYIEPNCLKELLDEADDFNVDVYAFLEKKIKVDSEAYTINCKQPLPSYGVISGKWASLNGFYPCSACAYFFNREFLINNDLFFVLGITHQDVEFTTRAITVAKKIVFTDHVPYYYDYNPDSLSRSKSLDKQKKYVMDEVRVAYYIQSYGQMQSDLEVRSLLEKRCNSIICDLFLTFLYDKSRRHLRKEVEMYAHEKGLYPIKRPLLTWKLTVLAFLLNQRWLINAFL